jgi:uncharacterized membrane protein
MAEQMRRTPGHLKWLADPGNLRSFSAGHWALAATLSVLGILGLLKGDFTAVWEPVPRGVPAREPLAYLCAVISLVCGAGLCRPRTAPHAARALLAWLLLWILLFRMPGVLRAPTVVANWEGCGETVVIAAAAWMLYARWAPECDRQHLEFATGARGARIASVLYGLAMLAFGAAHFAYVKQTAALIPTWLPWHTRWVYLTGFTYIAAGLALLAGVAAKLAAPFSALQMGAFTLMVWVPILAAGARDAADWNEALLSWALTAAGWVVADSCRLGPSSAPGSRCS